MDIISKISVTAFIHTAAIEMLSTVFLCYGLAVADGHVKPWLPMISDCAVGSPEKYPFRLGFVLGAVLLATQVVIVYNADKPYSRSKTSLILGTVASIGLAIVGVVNEDECNPVHSGAAIIFFVLYEANMVVLTWFTPNQTPEGSPAAVRWSLLIREACTIVGGVALVAFFFMSTSWGKYALYIAISEWTGTLAIILFNWSFAVDFPSLYVAEARHVSAKLTERKTDLLS